MDLSIPLSNPAGPAGGPPGPPGGPPGPPGGPPGNSPLFFNISASNTSGLFLLIILWPKLLEATFLPKLLEANFPSIAAIFVLYIFIYKLNFNKNYLLIKSCLLIINFYYYKRD